MEGRANFGGIITMNNDDITVAQARLKNNAFTAKNVQKFAKKLQKLDLFSRLRCLSAQESRKIYNFCLANHNILSFI